MKFILFFLLLSISSCHISGNFKGLYSYYNDAFHKNPNIFVHHKNTACPSLNDDKVHIINGVLLKNCLKQKPKTLVYIWAPRCQSKICLPLETIQEYCDANNLELFVTAEYYDLELMEKNYRIKNPIFGIDTDFYHTNLTSKYLGEFLKDLNVLSIKQGNRYYYFEYGEYIDSQQSIPL